MSKIKARNLEKLQQSMVKLIAVADEYGIIDLGQYKSALADDFVNLFTRASQEALTRRELERLSAGIQAFVRLPVYTTELSAAWLGVGLDRVRDAIWRADPPEICTMKLGHDVLIEHGELVRFSQN